MTKFVARTSLVLALAATLLAGACSKKEEKAAEPAQDMAAAQKPAEKPAEQPATPPEQPAATPAADPAADYIKLEAAHEPKAPIDPVHITVETFAVKSAKFDPANLEGATAELELDLSSIKSDKEKRDAHLKSPDYLDVAQFGMATVKISGTKKEADNQYTAQAEITAHGVTKTFPVKFTVLESKDGAIRVQGEHTFSRLDFSIGKEPDGTNEKVAKELIIKMQLTLKNS